MKALRALGFFVSTLLMFLGLPLLGWGLGAAGAFFATPQRRAYALLILLLGVLGGLQAYETPEGVRGGKVESRKKMARQSLVRHVLTALMLGSLSFIPFCERCGILLMPDITSLRWLGTGLFPLGMGMVYWSGLALGRLYSPEVGIQDDQQLTTQGPYRYIRHPRYLRGIIYALGISFLFRSWIACFLTILSIAVILFRIRDEEAMMRTEFGREWETYRQRSWKLIPYLY